MRVPFCSEPDLSLTLDLFTIGKDVMSAALRAERVQKLQVAEHFQNLANVFMAFPAAHRDKDRDRLTFLVAKTDSLIQSLQGSAVFATVLGKRLEKQFFLLIAQVLKQKELMAGGAQRELGYATIVSAAGFLEGYAESLRAQARKD